MRNLITISQVLFLIFPKPIFNFIVIAVFKSTSLCISPAGFIEFFSSSGYISNQLFHKYNLQQNQPSACDLDPLNIFYTYCCSVHKFRCFMDSFYLKSLVTLKTLVPCFLRLVIANSAAILELHICKDNFFFAPFFLCFIVGQNFIYSQ